MNDTDIKFQKAEADVRVLNVEFEFLKKELSGISSSIEKLNNKLDTQFMTKNEHDSRCQLTVQRLATLERVVYSVLGVVSVSLIGYGITVFFTAAKHI